MATFIQIGNRIINSEQITDAEQFKLVERLGIGVNVYLNRPEDNDLTFFNAEADALWAYLQRNSRDLMDEAREMARINARHAEKGEKLGVEVPF